MFITANISEGDKYTISDVKVTGETVLPQEQVEKMVPIKAGQTFSRVLIQGTTDSISLVLANIGYAFAEVTPVPEIEPREAHRLAQLRGQARPRVTVRRIVFKGNASTSDEVLRREMRQFEGRLYSQAMIDRPRSACAALASSRRSRSRRRKWRARRTRSSVVVTVKERNAGTFVFGIGYSQNAASSPACSCRRTTSWAPEPLLLAGRSNNSYSKSINFLLPLPPTSPTNGVSVGYRELQRLHRSNTTTARYGSGNAAVESARIPISRTPDQHAIGIYRISHHLRLADAAAGHPLPGADLGDRARNIEMVPDSTTTTTSGDAGVLRQDADPATSTRSCR